ncbi:LacI family DNA-binding transcriptional regulator [Oryzibacter oryziterrae]|uniref:LacI family DNA-binding transcriptional regulator n=1 Tax=Oryzibacter oryziterrae TaxID=2766474 RepID=UPI001F428B40|nr:LacI family DNA-binding transcriptional regulator [Oryzibacter oryziterrae]
MVTLKDVAREAGVSPKTVSRVINDDPAVNGETRDGVLAVIQRLNYVPDYAARMMRASTSSVVGLMTDVVATTPYAVDIIRGVHSSLKQDAHTLLIANTEGDTTLEQEYWRVFRAHKVSGVVFATMFHRALQLNNPHFDKPIVLANCYSNRRDLPAVLPDDEGGGYTQAQHLIELGHRKIGIITLNPVLRAASLRAAGYRSAFSEAGLSFSSAIELPGYAGPLDDESLVGYEAALELLQRKDRPTAIICGNDKVAIQVFAAAAFLGLSVPGDLSVIGFDDMQVITETLRPRLTSVGLPHYEMGLTAMNLLKAAAQQEAGVLTRTPTLLACPLVIRDSCRQLV